MLQFSIVIPNYNSGPVLERCIRSLIEQDYPALQLIMADAGSTDESREVIERYRDVLDVVISERDHGQADGLNKGFAHATGDVFGWLCADDELLPGALKHVAEVFQKDPAADVVNGVCERIYPDGTRHMYPSAPAAWDVIAIKNTIDQPSTFWRAELHRKLAPLDTSYDITFDWDMWVRMAKSGAKLVATDQPLSRFHFTTTNKCGCAGNKFADEALRIIGKYGPYKGGLAAIYRLIYRYFDLAGCYDHPTQCSKLRWFFHCITRMVLHVAIGKRLLNLYNLHFVACQERGMTWWR